MSRGLPCWQRNYFFLYQIWNTSTYFVYFKFKKELNYDRFVDPNILGASRLDYIRIYKSIEFQSLSLTQQVTVVYLLARNNESLLRFHLRFGG